MSRDCRRIDAILDALREGPIAAELKSMLETHARHCPGCARRWAGERALATATAELKVALSAIRMPAAFAPEVLRAARGRRFEPDRRAFGRALILVAATLAVAAVVIVAPWPSRFERAVNPRPPASDPAPDRHAGDVLWSDGSVDLLRAPGPAPTPEAAPGRGPEGASRAAVLVEWTL